MLGVLSSVITFLLILSFLVIIHELGHYVAARFFGVKVYEFGIGLPPKAVFLFRRWGTDFTLNWLPIGGFVKLAGEERTSQTIPDDSSQMFYSKGVWPRVIILLAGASVNFVFGILAFSTMFTALGIPEMVPVDQGVYVTTISQDSPAMAAGLEPGDVILSASLSVTENYVIEDTEQFIQLLNDNSGREIGLETLRENQIILHQVYIRTQDEIPAGDGAMGVGIAPGPVEFVKYPWWQRPIKGAWYGIVSAVEFGGLILDGLGSMVGNVFSTGSLPGEVAGPIGIVHIAYKENLLQEGFLSLLNFAAILSINLAIINVLPIPALDGGRVVFILLEKLIGRAFKPDFEQYANLIGFVLLISLIIVISVKDVGVIIGDLGGFSKLIFWR